MMAAGSDEYSKRTLDFVEQLQQLSGYDEIRALILKELEWFGFTCVTDWSLPGPGVDLKDSIWLNNRPPEYVNRYAEKNYVNRDPLVSELRSNLNPYSWGEIRERRELNKAEKTIMDEAREFGARDGFIVPIVTLSGSLSVFAPCGLEPNLSPRARAAVENNSPQAAARAEPPAATRTTSPGWISSSAAISPV
jgi:LuxR family quorum sensing-dependent transcriptional regulator